MVGFCVNRKQASSIVLFLPGQHYLICWLSNNKAIYGTKISKHMGIVSEHIKNTPIQK